MINGNYVAIHKPVLVKEIIEYLAIKPGAKIIDATINGGGHTSALLQKYPDIKILGIEWDPKIFEEAVKKLKSLKVEDRVILVNDSYVNLKNIVEKHDFHPDGILFDLGLSAWHYEKSGRGFSFKRNEILDMRFNPSTHSTKPQGGELVESTSSGQVPAAEIVNTYNREDLEAIFKEYGEEQFYSRIADAIIRARKLKPIIKTWELVKVIGEAVPEWYKHKKIHFATKTFQALRIAVNHELENVEKGMREAIEVLGPGGRLVVISFQGLEDKIVKNMFREKVKEDKVKFVVKGTIRPSWEETKTNVRARSAKMKVVEKV
ncbi:MAG: 16S rRNA (cytosine(1402)-N(4))-methyltransferase RsmH [Candidatus Yanofskybacteria bacterium]|nr:16S rRNA (cytosine(1402)-N(4))-methyltransferase RsmH [Candidatus Yanofskybacteria bacterium]